MATLFIDTTYDVAIGLLDKDNRWLGLKRFREKKSSSILQPEVLKLLAANNVKPRDLEAVVTVAGPGFYTGIRLSEGFSDVFKFFNIPHYAFYSYDIPEWCGESSGLWVTKAYRGEYFFHAWGNSEGRNEMVPAKDLEEYLKNASQIFTHTDGSLDAMALSFIKDLKKTEELLEQFPEKIFSRVLAGKMEMESFYFRPPEDEFKANP